MNAPTRIGIIGANWGMVGHLPVLRKLPNVEVVAVCTAHEESARKAAEEFGIPKPYWDYREMVRDPDIDLVDIGTKPANRYAMVLAALEAGKHVVNANPFALNLAQAEEMVAAQRAKGVMGAVEAQLPWTPQISRMRELLEEGYIGDLFNVICRCHFVLAAEGDASWPTASSPPGYPAGAAGYRWLGEAGSGASALRNMGGHCLYILLDLFGDVEEVIAHQDICLKQWSYTNGFSMEPANPDVALLIMRFKNGGTAQLNVSWAVAAGRGFGLEAYGSRGRLRVTAPYGFPNATNAELFGAKAGVPPVEEQALETPERLFRTVSGVDPAAEGRAAATGMYRMWDDLLLAIRDGGTFRSDFGRALQVQKIVEAAQVSQDRRSWVRLDELSASGEA